MDTTTRRAFLGKALLGGVGTAIGTTLGSPFSSALAQPTDDHVSDVDPNFIAGKIIESLGEGVYVVHDSNEQDRLVRTTSATRLWKRGRFNQTLQVGDCTYIRGELDQGGVLDVDRLWVDIQSYTVDVAEVRPGRLVVTLASNDLPMTVDVTSLTLVQNEDGSFTRGGDITHIGVGDGLQVIGFGDEPFTATRLFLLSGTTSASNPDEDVVDIVPDPLAPGNCLYTYKGVASWQCCGGVNACGSRDCNQNRCCPAPSSTGACLTCDTSKLQTAWPYIVNAGGNTCDVRCCSCCVGNSMHKLNCGKSMSMVNPCNSNSVTVKVSDCGPCGRCVQETGCKNYTKNKFDLTACAFSQIGNIENGLIACHAKVSLPCP